MLLRALHRVSLLCLVLGTIPAIAQNDLYDNGPSDGQDFAWTIGFGYVVSDAFTLNSNSTVNGLSFTAWVDPDNILQTAEVSITSSEFGGTTYFDQTVSFTQSSCVGNQFGYNVCTESGALGTNLNLAAGTYWLNLQNADTNIPDEFAYWDQNGGPSLASENSEGTIPSESFTILGSSETSTGSTPEPASILLFGSGIFGLVGILRYRLL